MMSSMKRIDHPLAVDEPVGSEAGRSPSALSTGQATPGLATSPPATPGPKVGPLAPGQRWSVVDLLRESGEVPMTQEDPHEAAATVYQRV